MTPPHPSSHPHAPRVLFAAGNGDVGGTLRSWTERNSDTRIMAEAYSAEVYELAHAQGWTLLACPNNPRPPSHAGRIAVIPLPKPRARRWRFYYEEFRYGLRLAAIARRFKADLIISATGMHPVGRLAMCRAGVPIVLSLHNTFWTRATPQPSGLGGLISRLACRLSTQVRQAVCVSEEIKRQTVALGLLAPQRVRVFIPQYDIEQLPWTDPPTSPAPFTILFAGRVESYKGIDDMIAAAKILQDRHPGRFAWRIAGRGPYLETAQAHAAKHGLAQTVHFLGPLDRAALSAEIAACSATITPTRTAFREGLAKLPLEGAGCGKPAIVSTAVPALDLLADAAEPVEPSDPHSIARAAERLHDDPDLYRKRHEACRLIRAKIADRDLGYGAMLGAAVADALAPARS